MGIMYVVSIKLPGHVFSEASQELRDRINNFLNENCPNEEVNSFYSADEDPYSTDPSRYKSARYLHFEISDLKIAILFKLTLG